MIAELPAGLRLQRSAEFDPATVPAGLLRSHRLADDVWAEVSVRSGSLAFVWEDESGPGSTVELRAGDSIVVPPRVPHRVELLDDDTAFTVSFHR